MKTTLLSAILASTLLVCAPATRSIWLKRQLAR